MAFEVGMEADGEAQKGREILCVRLTPEGGHLCNAYVRSAGLLLKKSRDVPVS
ncbi:MAG: hypothetical protein JXA79_09035 [Deltaproteobacteria bacterium]|nr:hypothetical protein [Deltaproteobacteria bacterium]